MKHTALSSKGLECQSWLKLAPISRRGRRNVLNGSWLNTCEGRACICQAFHVYQEERVLILQISDNVFTASVIPNPFQTQSEKLCCCSPVLLHFSGSINLGHRRPVLSSDHISTQPRRKAKGSQDFCHSSAGQEEGHQAQMWTTMA